MGSECWIQTTRSMPETSFAPSAKEITEGRIEDHKADEDQGNGEFEDLLAALGRLLLAGVGDV